MDTENLSCSICLSHRQSQSNYLIIYLVSPSCSLMQQAKNASNQPTDLLLTGVQPIVTYFGNQEVTVDGSLY